MEGNNLNNMNGLQNPNEVNVQNNTVNIEPNTANVQQNNATPITPVQQPSIPTQPNIQPQTTPVTPTNTPNNGKKNNSVAIVAGLVLFGLIIAVIVFLVLSKDDDKNTSNDDNANNNTNSGANNSTATKDAILLEGVYVRGYACFGSQCTITIEEDGNYVDYVFGADNVDLIQILNDYNDYTTVNIYYTENGSERTIVDYKVFLKSNNEDISSVKTEEELRAKIGLYSIGTHTETFTLTEIGMIGAGFQDDISYTYIDYTLIDSKNNEYEMKYIISEGSSELNLTEGNNYTVTFEVVEDLFGYEFYIKSIN